MSKKIKIYVLMGGFSAEREISLVTGRAICTALDRKKYKVIPLEWGKDRNFYILTKNRKKQFDLFKNKNKIDKIFIALHGPGGEDGCIQGLLECLDIPYTGSGVMASALAMNKALLASIYKQQNILTPKFVDFRRAPTQGRDSGVKFYAKLKKQIKHKIGYPLIIKPVDQGSSVGVFLVKSGRELSKFVKKSFETSNWLMAQEFIEGKEATCGVLERRGKPFAVPPTRIVANVGQFYDYKSKYDDGGSTHICPADFKASINKKLQSLAVQAHRALGCRGMSRTDFFVTPKGKIYAIETNTIPGMTPMSLLPEAAGKIGISFSKMLELIIES